MAAEPKREPELRDLTDPHPELFALSGVDLLAYLGANPIIAPATPEVSEASAKSLLDIAKPDLLDDLTAIKDDPGLLIPLAGLFEKHTSQERDPFFFVPVSERVQFLFTVERRELFANMAFGLTGHAELVKDRPDMKKRKLLTFDYTDPGFLEFADRYYAPYVDFCRSDSFTHLELALADYAWTASGGSSDHDEKTVHARTKHADSIKSTLHNAMKAALAFDYYYYPEGPRRERALELLGLDPHLEKLDFQHLNLDQAIALVNNWGTLTTLPGNMIPTRSK